MSVPSPGSSSSLIIVLFRAKRLALMAAIFSIDMASDRDLHKGPQGKKPFMFVSLSVLFKDLKVRGQPNSLCPLNTYFTTWVRINILDDPSDENTAYLSMLLTMEDFLGASKRRASCSLIFCTSLSSYRGFLAVLSDASSTALFTYKVRITVCIRHGTVINYS